MFLAQALIYGGKHRARNEIHKPWLSNFSSIMRCESAVPSVGLSSCKPLIVWFWFLKISFWQKLGLQYPWRFHSQNYICEGRVPWKNTGCASEDVLRHMEVVTCLRKSPGCDWKALLVTSMKLLRPSSCGFGTCSKSNPWLTQFLPCALTLESDPWIRCDSTV